MATRKSVSNPATDAASAPAEAAIKTVAPRNSPLPRASAAKAAAPAQASANGNAAAPPPAASYDDIARRAYELWQSGSPGGEIDHWVAAERELKCR